MIPWWSGVVALAMGMFAGAAAGYTVARIVMDRRIKLIETRLDHVQQLYNNLYTAVVRKERKKQCGG
jgi:hypothetical protein